MRGRLHRDTAGKEAAIAGSFKSLRNTSDDRTTDGKRTAWEGSPLWSTLQPTPGTAAQSPRSRLNKTE